MANFANYDNMYDILSAIGSSDGMKSKRIDIALYTTGYQLGGLIKNLFAPHASEIGYVKIPVLKIFVPVGGYININIGDSLNGKSGPQIFRKVYGTEDSVYLDGKWVGVEIYNTSDTLRANMPYIEILDGVYTFSASGYVSIINHPKILVIIPRANGESTASGMKIHAGYETTEHTYNYNTGDNVIRAWQNYKIFDVSDIVEDSTTSLASAGEQYGDGLQSFAQYNISTDVWASFYLFRNGSCLGNIVDEAVKRLMIMTDQECAYVSHFIKYYVKVATSNFLPTDVMLANRYIEVIYK